MLDGSRLACDSGGPVLRPSPIAGFAIRFAVAVTLCLGAATKDALTQSAFWLSGLATGESAAEEGYFHSHGVGEVAHWHPWDAEPAAKPTSGGESGFSPASGAVHDHATSPSIVGAVATFDFAVLDVLSPVVESGRIVSQFDVRSSVWRVMRPRGPPAV
jgi:hypothetical protein